jgi:hypothetical protein
MITRFSFIFCVLCASAANVLAAPIPEKIDFNRDVRPILSENCFFCHGPDKNKRKADLRLDTKEGLFTAIEKKRFPAVPGHPEQSEIFKRIITTDDDDRMPDPKSGKHLTDHDIAVFKKWIEQGAEFKGHWAYIKPVKAAAPEVGTVNPIDAFLLARLKEQKLRFSKEADRATLVRRLYLDLLGLPPTPAQVNAFVNDASPAAYENLVDQLLASPHFGERMAVYWLDLVRYADTIGYHSDNPRDIAPYRDWVINAFNSNLPFDQFTIDQLAGDLLPNATMQQKVASGYNRLLQTTEEGGAQPKEYLAKYNADRVRNFSSVWMAATMGCCECHDHKFDPYSTKDFYSLGSFFADVREPGVGRREPGMPVPDEKQQAELAQRDGRIAELRKKLETSTPELIAAQEGWETSQAGKAQVEWVQLTPVQAKAASGTALKINGDKTILAGGKAKDADTYTVTAKTKLKGITAIRLEALTDKSLPKNGPGRADNGNFVLTELSVEARADQSAKASPVKLQNASATIEQTFAAEKNPYKKWAAASAIDGDVKGANWGWAVLDQKNNAGADQSAVFETAEDLGDGSETTLTFTLKQNHGTRHVLGKFRLAVTNSPRPVAAAKELPREVVAALAVDGGKRSAGQKKILADYYRGVAPLLASLRAELSSQERDREEFTKTFRRSLVSVAEAPRVTRVLPRGNWNTDAGEIVTPAVPHFLPQIRNSQSAIGNSSRLNRLDLAHWVVSPENPLTARVVVNRLWKLFYGVGISKSLEDLGSQGELPTNQELLDYLACDFQQPAAGTGQPWDIKRMVRLMVTTEAYRQTSYASPELKELDPFNRLYARQARFRLDAEFVRDNALAISGLLADKIGGESVKPYQPASHWDFLNFPTRTWVHDKGENEYRRGLYTWWQRSFPQPSLTNFDAPSREECTAERARSNTPQQALTLLNDPTYVEAARVFAERILKEGGPDLASRLQFAWRMALCRPAKPEEIAVLSTLYEKHKNEYAGDKKDADALAAAGEAPRAKDVDPAELAAWTSVSRTILNLHETITRN